MHEFGRVYIEDARDRQYPIRSMLPAEPDKRWRYWHDNRLWIEQVGPTCVGAASAHYLADGPITDTMLPAFPDYRTIYSEAQKRDEWSGENYDGTSARGAMKYLHEIGLIEQYRWAFTADEIVRALLSEGPVMLGCWWWSGMMATTRDGLIEATGVREGGHEVLLNGVNTDQGIVRGKNSWNRDWGDDGRFRCSLDTLATLIEDQGDAVVALERTGGG